MNNRWITEVLPDSDQTVLLRLTDAAYPVWPGFHDGECWRSAETEKIEGLVTGWMHLYDAAFVLDNEAK